VSRDFFQDRKSAAERLDPDPLAVVGVVVDIGLQRLHQPGKRGLARRSRFLRGLWLGTRSHSIKSPADGAGIITTDIR
jgi:hypothetical protein